MEERATYVTTPSVSIRISRARSYRRIALYAVAITGAFAFMAPFFWTISSSLKAISELFVFPPSMFPAIPQWDNYVKIWQMVPFAIFLLNSITVTSLSLIGTILSGSIVAYSFARFRYPGRDLFFLLTLSSMMLPYEVTLIPTYLLFNKIGWLDTFKPLIIPFWFGGGAFNIFLLRQFFMTIPRELDDAARIDGANFVRIYWNVLMPLSGPVLATVAVIGFIHHWNDFLGPLIFLDSQTKYTLAIGLHYFQTEADAGGMPMQNLLMAASVTFTIPCIVLFFLAQRYIVQGITLSGIRG